MDLITVLLQIIVMKIVKIGWMKVFNYRKTKPQKMETYRSTAVG